MKAENSKPVLKIPLTNTLAQGGYTAAIRIGSQKRQVRLVVDSGSSTLAVHHSKYQPEEDLHLQPTTLAQEIRYGLGGWVGPVVHTQIELISTTLAQVPLAVVQAEMDKTFLEADGIWGLAYAPLNPSYDFSDYLTTEGMSPPATYPWPFPVTSDCSKTLDDFRQLQAKAKEADLPSSFDQLEQQGFCSNRFSFICQRSSIHIDPQYPHFSHDPLNQGWLLLGGGAEQTQHYQGDFSDLAVLHDRYYNVDLKSINVAGQPPIQLPSIESCEDLKGSSNALVDTGASLISLPAAAFNQLIEQLSQAVAGAAPLLAPFCGDMEQIIAEQQQGIDASLLNLEDWPAIEFHFQGNDGQLKQLTCPADHYWQLNSPAHGKAVFKLMGQLPKWPPQSIIGLPLISAYYVVFERDESANGLVRFAEPRSR